MSFFDGSCEAVINGETCVSRNKGKAFRVSCPYCLEIEMRQEREECRKSNLIDEIADAVIKKLKKIKK